MIDRDAVENLIGRYCESVSSFDTELFGSLWAPGAVWEIPGSENPVGRAAIVDAFTEMRSLYPLCVQEILSGVVAPDDAGASARWHVRELQWRSEGDGSQLIGVYHDRVVAGDDGLWFTNRRFRILYRGPVDLSGMIYDRNLRQPDAD